MNRHSLAREQLDAARSSAGRSAAAVYGGDEKALRHTLGAGCRLDDHEKPGDLILIPPALHSLLACEDAALLLTAVPRAYTA